MRIIFVRHGEPDYVPDCLTPEGWRQAEAAAKRLAGEGISKIYASPMGRAAQTASCTARLLGLPVVTLDFMREISWGGEGIPEEGHPWTLGDRLLEVDNFDFYAFDWREHPYFKGNAAVDYLDRISERFDALLLEHGYHHEGRRFLCQTDAEETFAVFSHGGSGACALSHLLALPFPYMASAMTFDFTSVTILSFPTRPGEYVRARLELFNDCAHIGRHSDGPAIQQVSGV